MELLIENWYVGSGTVSRLVPASTFGRMCQRVLIAIRLAYLPRLLIVDELTFELYITTQRQALDYLQQLVDELNTSLLLIIHDLDLTTERARLMVVVYCGLVNVIFCSAINSVRQETRVKPSIDSRGFVAGGAQ
ncbi:hypothetical protein [Mycobacterium uberis]|uniref:hypothetical protein n=1 Tax=Mycobacterium uberis TaxID=2162698 RepID=UPI001FB4C897|nr:hypothetical protein [Mycobacterium uberis]